MPTIRQLAFRSPPGHPRQAPAQNRAKLGQNLFAAMRVRVEGPLCRPKSGGATKRFPPVERLSARAAQNWQAPVHSQGIISVIPGDNFVGELSLSLLASRIFFQCEGEW